MKLPSFKLIGERTLLLEWPADVSRELFEVIANCHDLLDKQLGPFIDEMVPAYASLAIYLKPSADVSDFIQLIEAGNFPELGEREGGKIVHVPVCYEPPYGPDLQYVADHCKLDPETVIAKHLEPSYLVHFIGFLPGFPYLGGLDPRLEVPRRSSPRRVVERGSVAIAEGQAGIYPQSSPGGWQILGRTPLVLFDANQQPPAIIRRGDRLRFIRVNPRKFEEIRKKIDTGSFQIKIQEL